ncbi:MAG: serine protein kinase, partial [Deltaproteobacteria bacterium RBG_13_49_15]
MESIDNALLHLEKSVGDVGERTPVTFEAFLGELITNPNAAIRNVFQVFHDMVKTYVGEGIDEYPNDPESIGYVFYDCSNLLVAGADHPFFADRLFANRLMKHVEAMRHGAQQNKIYIIDGPPGCGKSTFLNNLLKKFEEYANTKKGLRFEMLWRLDRKTLGGMREQRAAPLFEKLSQFLEHAVRESDECKECANFESGASDQQFREDDEYVEIPCPSHDNPILIIPREYRRSFLDDLFRNDEFKWKLSTEKEYEWVFKDNPCTICSTLYEALLEKLKNPLEVFKMVYARSYRFNRRLGEGISVFNPGDQLVRQNVLTNPMFQRRINAFFRDSNQVQYLYSRYAKTNNGIYALMDIKSRNAERLIELHNIISEKVHKVEDIEENVNSLFLAVMNPEDKKNFQDIQSFSDRIQYIRIPYVMDLRTEVDIYRNIFGKHIDENFLPRVLHNFARVIISSRLNTRSDALVEWLGGPDKYGLYCDRNLQLLKMELYAGYIPPWLSEEDRKNFTAKRRQKVIAESENEGEKGFSGRDSIKLFNRFYSAYAREGKLINMSMLCYFFDQIRKEETDSIPEGFLESLHHLYDYTILQEVKESLYYYNEEQIAKDVQNYLFALNFEIGSTATCTFTGEQLEITEDFLSGIENQILGAQLEQQKRLNFRKETQKEYTSNTLTQEIMLEGKSIAKTDLYQSLYERYVYNLKKRVLDPFLKNENFRQAIKEYGEESFKTYDQRIRGDVAFLMENLIRKYHY